MATIRRYRAADDAAALTQLLHASRLRGELPDIAERDVAWFVDYAATVAEELAVAADDDGTLIGVLVPEVKVVVVTPERRRNGIGTALVAEGRRIETERGRPNVLMGPVAGDQQALAFLRACGFRYHSSVWRLDLPADVPVPAPSFPPELTARPFGTGDEEAYVDVFNGAFASHPTDDGPVMAGEIAFLGVRPELQGRGLGRELLRWGVDRLRSLDVPSLFLTVNVTNERALGLYEQHGFRRTREKPRGALPVGA